MAGRTELSPQERTEAFIKQDVRDLHPALIDRDIHNTKSGNTIRVDQAELFLEVGFNYRREKSAININTLDLGMLWAYYIPRFHMSQALVTAGNNGEKGACIRLKRASRYDPEKRLFIPMPNEGDITRWLGIDPGDAMPLRFIDDTEVLFLGTGNSHIAQEVNRKASTDYLKSLIGE